MTYTKHTVHTDALDSLGTILTGNEAERDAIHVAVYRAEAGTDIVVGSDVRLAGDGKAYMANPEDSIGIADPWIRDMHIEAGDHFWICLNPRQITSLNHVWEHPAFPRSGVVREVSASDADKLKSEGYLRSWVHSDYKSFEDWMEEVTSPDSYYKDEYFITIYGSDASGPVPHEFWDHVETYTGKRIEAKYRNNTHFSCTC